MNMKMRLLKGIRAWFFAFTAFGCVALMAAPTLASTTGSIYTNDGTNVRVRSGPGTTYDTVGSASAGTTCTITEQSNGWYHVTVNGLDGWVSSQLVTGEDTSAIPEAGSTSTTTTTTTDSTAADDSSTTTSSSAIGTLAATVGNDTYLVSERFTEEDIPAGFVESDTTYQDETVKCVFNETLQMKLMYLKADADDSRSFFIYYPDTQSFLPFVMLGSGENYVVVTNPPADTAVPDGYSPASLPNDATGLLSGYSNSGLADCYYIYGVDSNGSYGWYIYDAQYGSFARTTGLATSSATASADAEEEEESYDMNEAYNELKDEYTATKNKMVKIIAGLVIGCAVLLIILVNVLIFGGKNDQGDVFDDDDDEDDNDEKDSGLSRKELKKKKKEAKKKKRDFWDDDDDDDDWLTDRKKQKEEAAKANNSEVEEATKESKKTASKKEDKKTSGKEAEEISLEDELRNAVSGILNENAKEKAEADATADIEAALAAAVEEELKAAKVKEEAPAVTAQQKEAPAESTRAFEVPTGATIDLSDRIIREAIGSAEEPVQDDTSVTSEFTGGIEDLDYAERASVAAAFANTQEAEEPAKTSETTQDGFEFFDFDDNDDNDGK